MEARARALGWGHRANPSTSALSQAVYKERPSAVGGMCDGLTLPPTLWMAGMAIRGHPIAHFIALTFRMLFGVSCLWGSLLTPTHF